MTENIRDIRILVVIHKLFLANFFIKAHLILRRLLFVDLFKYFKWKGKRDCLPDPHGPLYKQVP